MREKTDQVSKRDNFLPNSELWEKCVLKYNYIGRMELYSKWYTKKKIFLSVFSKKQIYNLQLEFL